MIDYILVDKEVSNAVTEMLIDEECLYTPFHIVHDKKEKRAQYSDHNTILCKFEVDNAKNVEKCKLQQDS